MSESVNQESCAVFGTRVEACPAGAIESDGNIAPVLVPSWLQLPRGRSRCPVMGAC